MLGNHGIPRQHSSGLNFRRSPAGWASNYLACLATARPRETSAPRRSYGTNSGRRSHLVPFRQARVRRCRILASLRYCQLRLRPTLRASVTQ